MKLPLMLERRTQCTNLVFDWRLAFKQCGGETERDLPRTRFATFFHSSSSSNMTIMLHFTAHTILQKDSAVVFKGAWVAIYSLFLENPCEES